MQPKIKAKNQSPLADNSIAGWIFERLSGEGDWRPAYDIATTNQEALDVLKVAAVCVGI